MFPGEIEILPKNPEILRSIERGHIEFIQRNIKVNYNNKLQSPVSFYYEDKEHKVIEVEGIFRGDLSPRDVSYLVKTQSSDVYLLHLHFSDTGSQGFLAACRWVLGFRVLKDEELMSLYREEKAMLVDIRLKIVADFHGHLCPDLVIGWRACRLAREILGGEGQIREDFMVIAENRTAALDAIQYTLGCTLGNQRLQIVDTGQHNYIFIINKARHGVKLSLKKLYFDSEDQYSQLGEKIINNQATIIDAATYQELLDNRIKKLLELQDKGLFASERVIVCPFCGDYVLASLLVKQEGFLICKSCLARLKETSTQNIYH